MKASIVLSLLVAGVVAFFALQNAQATRVSFFSWYVEAPLVLLLMGTFAAGAVAAWLALVPGSIRKSLEISRLKAKEAVPPAGKAATGDDRPSPPPGGKSPVP